ncbi:box C/D snoRNA protein 1-like [Glandiceps talaboti]
MQEARCEVCTETIAKYRCPRCAVRTCSLPCVKVHKNDSSCNGIRDKTAYVAMKEFSEGNLLNDYRFLEEVDRKADNVARHIRRKHRHGLPHHLKYLMRMARQRGVTLRVLPYVFTKRKENSTMFSSRDQEVLWHIEWIFVQSGVKYFDRRVSEKMVLRNALKKYIDAEKSDPVIKQRLKKYVSAGFENVQLFMKVERRSAKSVRYEKLNLDQTIKENLSSKYIIEYPTLYVVLSDCYGDFPIQGEVLTECSGSSSSSSGTDSSSSSEDSSSEDGDDSRKSSGSEDSNVKSQTPVDCSEGIVLHESEPQVCEQEKNELLQDKEVFDTVDECDKQRLGDDEVKAEVDQTVVIPKNNEGDS